MNNRKNLISALVYQMAHIIYGLILPRLVIKTFGSDLNGLVSSITQFLSFISLLEGGLGAVVLAELYKPIEENDRTRISEILYSCQRFFEKLAFVFCIYTIILAGVYSYNVREVYSIPFTATLVLILSLTTLAQYLFAITNRLYLQANQKIYIVNYVSSITLIANIIVAFLVISIYPEVHVLKLLSSIAFFIQPLIYSRYVEKEFRGLKRSNTKKVVLRNRWSGFAQNLAHFINMNTDIALITLFSTFGNVSVYSVYLLSINAIKSVIANVANSFQSALGKYIAENNKEQLIMAFNLFCKGTWSITLILFCTCLLLINPFVLLYTKGINDTDYYQPFFGLIIVIANLIYCIREPYRLLILSAGKFKETNFGSIMEAVINIVISIALIQKLGLLGIAIGTLVAIVYRLIYFMHFLTKDILNIEASTYIVPYLKMLVIVIVNVVAYFTVKISINSIISFVFYGISIVLVETLLIVFLVLGVKDSKKLLLKTVRR